MNLKDQVTSLELAKRLKELGVKQESLFYWWRHEGDSRYILINPILDNRTPKSYIDAYAQAEMYSAFTVAELGEMLPQNFHCWKWKRERTLRQEGGEMVWNCFTDESTETAPGIVIIADTEANVRAKMLVFLLENKLI